MVQIPDSLRQQLAPVVKYHFWILAALVPLILVPALFMAAGQLKGEIARERATIDGHVSALNAVRNEPDHPNDAWTKVLAGRTAAVREELLREWTAFWKSQEPLRVWPEILGPDFLTAISAVESGDRPELQFRDLQRYQNTVPDIVRGLPKRMGCEEMMAELEGGPRGELPGFGRRPGFGGGLPGEAEDDPEASQTQDPLVWEADDQKRLFASFFWAAAPSTTQVLLAQEELWAYGLFCDVIRTLNDGAKGAYDAAVTTVDELAVGYPAAEEKPGGQGGGRVIGVRRPEVGLDPGGFAEGLPPLEPGSEMAGGRPGMLEGRPEHPRFSAAGGGLEGMMPGRGRLPPQSGEVGLPDGELGEGEAEASLSEDDLLKQWIYVDFTGQPLTAPELETVPDAQLVHLMPFVLRVVIDQRQVDRLLRELAGNPVPIDVRQVRINPPTTGMGEDLLSRGGSLPGGGRGSGIGPEGGLGDGRRRPFDVTLELRGTVGLATPPNPAVFGTESDGDEASGPEEGG